MGFWKTLGSAFSGRSTEPPASAPKPASPGRAPKDVFRELFVGELEQHPRVGRIAPNPEQEFSLLVWPSDALDSAKPWTIYLDNIFHETREMSPEQSSAAIQRFMSALDETGDLSWEEARHRLVPLVRAASFCADSELQLVRRELVPFLCVFAGVDRDDSTSFVTTKQLAEWQRAAPLVHDLALENFARFIAESDIEPYDSESSSSILHVATNDSYESSRLALPGFLAGFAGRVPGAPVAIVPDRSRLLICGSGDAEAVARLAKIAEAEFNAAARALSPALYTVDPSGKVVPLHLPAEHPHHFLVERGHRLLAASAYADQKARLEKRLIADGIDIFIATCGLLRTKAGQTQTWASMAEGVDALLPEVDLVCLSGGPDDTEWYAHVPWPKFFEVAGDCLERDPEHDPPRWRTVGWPDEQAVEQLGDLVKRKT